MLLSGFAVVGLSSGHWTLSSLSKRFPC